MGFVVEFCGLPGAGKSTLARTVVAQLRLRGVPTTEVMVRLGPDAGSVARFGRKLGAIAAAATEPGSVRLAANVGFRSGQHDRRDQIARPANLLVVRHSVRRAHRRMGVHVLDQGPLQEWWSAALRADQARVLEYAALDPAERADLVVRVDAPIDVLVARLEARGARQSRLEGLDPDARARELERGELLFASLADQLVHSAGARTPELLRVAGLDPTASQTIVEAVVRSL